MSEQAVGGELEEKQRQDYQWCHGKVLSQTALPCGAGHVWAGM